VEVAVPAIVPPKGLAKIAIEGEGMINTTQHVVAVCQPGKGAATCRYLTMDDDG